MCFPSLNGEAIIEWPLVSLPPGEGPRQSLLYRALWALCPLTSGQLNKACVHLLHFCLHCEHVTRPLETSVPSQGVPSCCSETGHWPWQETPTLTPASC